MATLSILTPGTSVPPRNALTDEYFLIRFFMPSAEYPARGFSREYQRHYYLMGIGLRPRAVACLNTGSQEANGTPVSSVITTSQPLLCSGA